jgi:hypothetical protein
VLTAEECRHHSAECLRFAEQTSNARVKAILLDMARTWTRLALEAEQWSQDVPPAHDLQKRRRLKIGSGLFTPILFRPTRYRGRLGILKMCKSGAALDPQQTTEYEVAFPAEGLGCAHVSSGTSDIGD